MLVTKVNFLKKQLNFNFFFVKLTVAYRNTKMN